MRTLPTQGVKTHNYYISLSLLRISFSLLYSSQPTLASGFQSVYHEIFTATTSIIEGLKIWYTHIATQRCTPPAEAAARARKHLTWLLRCRSAISKATLITGPISQKGVWQAQGLWRAAGATRVRGEEWRLGLELFAPLELECHLITFLKRCHRTPWSHLPAHGDTVRVGFLPV